MENPVSRELLSGQDAEPANHGSGQLISDTPLVPGIYRLSLEPPTDAIESYAITMETSESNLAAAVGESARTRLSGVDAPIYTRWHDGEAPTALDQPGRPLGRFFLSMLLGLLVVELAMAWHFRAGLVALGGGVQRFPWDGGPPPPCCCWVAGRCVTVMVVTDGPWHPPAQAELASPHPDRPLTLD